jgi:hypothetical protein
MITIRTIIATAALTAATAAGPAACDPATKSQHPTAHTPTSTVTPPKGNGCDQDEPDYVCGTCPDGTTWGYLNDPQYTNDPVISKLFFDNNHPCG